ncbi:uncharacterized protein [Embiotoca jacksoni]|uniref:uncharacterized protein n=1 Tax=Embiotoca jacksoni TaxID=100190 RepID=UPI003704B50E
MSVQNEFPADGQRVTYNTAEENQPNLTINDLRETDASYYCCRRTADQPDRCWLNYIKLLVTDLQVKVFPTTEGLTVTLMCSTSCPLTGKPAAFIWYKNREFLYEDWSPWYQELVSSEEAVRYSCAIKGYEELRAPEVSVGECQCSSMLQNLYLNHQSIPLPSNDSFSCAAKGLEHHQSAEVCAEVQKCRSVNYVSRRICALQGSSVNISSKYFHPDTQQPTSKSWYKKNRSGKEELVEASGDVEDYDERNNHHHILTIKNLKKNDSAQYTFRLQREDGGLKESFLHGVLLTVTDLQVKFTPSAEVTEGQRVTLTCSTSCPLTDNTNYIWYFNSRPLTLPEHQNKHLLLDPVSSQRAGKYSCAVRTNKNFNSAEKSLTVQSLKVRLYPAEVAEGQSHTDLQHRLSSFW